MHNPHLKVLIIGAGGRLGAALTRRYQQKYHVIPFRKADLDVLRPDAFHQVLAPLEFDVAIYAAGLTNVDYCEDHVEEARLANAVAPAILAEICSSKKAHLIHISTDYVFDGKKNQPLKETEPANPLSAYGKSKFEGENAVLSISDQFLVIRISWLFGPDRPSFPDLILKQALENDKVAAIADKVSCPTYSEDLAEWIELMLTDPSYHGILHLCNTGSSTWQQYGQTTLDIAFNLGLPIKTSHVEPLFRENFPLFKAERPEFTAFDTSKYTQLSKNTPRPWQEALRDYIKSKYCQLI